MSFESFATGVRALECVLSSFRSTLLYSLRVLLVFFATLIPFGMIGKAVY